MSSNAPPLTLISSTPPSQVDSRSNRCLKVTVEAAELTANDGEVSSLLPEASALFTKAALGTVSAALFVVTHGNPSLAVVPTHPEGRLGTPTPSKFCCTVTLLMPIGT